MTYITYMYLYLHKGTILKMKNMDIIIIFKNNKYIYLKNISSIMYSVTSIKTINHLIYVEIVVDHCFLSLHHHHH